MPTLLLENGPDRGKGLELRPGETYTLGRDPNCQLVLHGELVSRQHCRVKEFKGAYYVKDLDSLNGVLVNDQRVSQAEIKPGDKVQLGDLVLTFLDESLAKSKEEKTLGGYRLLERIGRGGMGTVYRAIQVSLDREVALKVLSPDLVRDPAFVEQFFREARAAGQLNHPHIVQVYDVGQEGDAFYYSMEYVRGGSLEDRLREEGRVAVQEALRIADEAAMALEYAESRGIVHRDIKPDNLMLAEDGRVRVADLGLALSLKSSADHKGQPILGTPHFISPEQALRREIDIRSDIYSLGATLYRMLAGRTVFQGSSAEEIIRKAVREPPQPLRELNAEVPEKVAALVHRMLAKNPDERFASARELREAIERLTRHPGRTWALIAASAVAVVAIGLAITFALKEPEERVIHVEAPGLADARLREFEAKTDLEKRNIQYEALQKYTGLLETPRDREAMRQALSAWLAEYDYLEIPQKDTAAARIVAIDAEIAREEAARLALEERRRGLVAAARDSVAEPLDQGEHLAALAAALRIAPPPDADAATVAALEGEKSRLVQDVMARIRAKCDRIDGEIAAAQAAGDVQGALRLARAAADGFAARSEPLPEPIAAELEARHASFAAHRDRLEGQLADASAALIERERGRLLDALGPETRGRVLQLDVTAAAERIETVLAQAETPELRAQLEPIAVTLRSGAALLERALAALESGTLPLEPQFRLQGAERAGELVEFDRATRLLKLRTSSPRGSVSTTLPLADLANADALRQLLADRLPLTPEERVDLVEFMTVVEVMRWAESLAPLAARSSGWTPAQGWSDELRSGLPRPPEPALASEVERVIDPNMNGGAERASRARIAAMNEERCALELITALDPFFEPESRVGWTGAAALLRRLLEERRETLLLRIVRPWIDGA